MSKFVDEIIADIRTYPETWRRLETDGLIKGDISISNCGNGGIVLLWFPSCVDVTINGKGTWRNLSWADKFNLEETFKWWMRNASVEMMQADKDSYDLRNQSPR